MMESWRWVADRIERRVIGDEEMKELEVPLLLG